MIRRRLPFLRWSVWRMLLGMRHLTTHWQVGDGREAELESYVLANARPGDVSFEAAREVELAGLAGTHPVYQVV